jgi:hypothetical protein
MSGAKTPKAEDPFPRCVAAPTRRALAAVGVMRSAQSVDRTESELLELDRKEPKALAAIKAELRTQGLPLACQKQAQSLKRSVCSLSDFYQVPGTCHLVVRRVAVPSRRAKVHTEYHKDGSVWAKGPMHEGVPTGYWEWFRKDGTRMRSGSFLNGVQVGEWTTYDRDGKVYKVTILIPKP